MMPMSRRHGVRKGHADNALREDAESILEAPVEDATSGR
jgi:hypothetical protein